MISITCLSRYISLSFYRPALFQTSESCIKLHAVDVLELSWVNSVHCSVCVCVCVCVCVSTASKCVCVFHCLQVCMCVCVHCSRCVVSTAPSVCCVCPLLQVCVCVCPLLQCVCVCVCVHSSKCVCPLLRCVWNTENTFHCWLYSV